MVEAIRLSLWAAAEESFPGASSRVKGPERCLVLTLGMEACWTWKSITEYLYWEPNPIVSAHKMFAQETLRWSLPSQLLPVPCSQVLLFRSLALSTQLLGPLPVAPALTDLGLREVAQAPSARYQGVQQCVSSQV